MENQEPEIIAPFEGFTITDALKNIELPESEPLDFLTAWQQAGGQVEINGNPETSFCQVVVEASPLPDGPFFNVNLAACFAEYDPATSEPVGIAS